MEAILSVFTYTYISGIPQTVYNVCTCFGDIYGKHVKRLKVTEQTIRRANTYRRNGLLTTGVMWRTHQDIPVQANCSCSLGQAEQCSSFNNTRMNEYNNIHYNKICLFPQ